MSRLGYPIFDADNHLYESQDALTRHLPTTHKNLFRLIELGGRKKLLVRDRLTEFIPNPTFEVVARPGAYMPYFKGDNPEGKTFRELTGTPMKAIPAFREPAARLRLLDEQGIDACLMFPTLFSLVEERLKDDPDAVAVAVRAFNEWLHDEWSYDYRGRIFATPVLNPGLVDEGIAELERVIERGAKVVLMRPAAVSGLRGARSPFLPEFDPFWARVQEAGLVVALHQSDSGYQDYVNAWEGRGGEMLAFKAQAFASVLDGGSRAIHDALASAVCHGMLHRFPGVKLISVENGGDWVPSLLHHLELTYKKMPKEFREHPVETFKRSVWVNPFWEESLADLVTLIGADRICFGSDYPHAEGLEEPLSWIDDMPPLDAPTVQRIVSSNMYELLSLQPAR
jgi:predicted TIM-barrel fold metal-dependent hydrolase